MTLEMAGQKSNDKKLTKHLLMEGNLSFTFIIEMCFFHSKDAQPVNNNHVTRMYLSVQS